VNKFLDLISLKNKKETILVLFALLAGGHILAILGLFFSSVLCINAFLCCKLKILKNRSCCFSVRKKIETLAEKYKYK
jgi:hypothetical protein